MHRWLSLLVFAAALQSGLLVQLAPCFADKRVALVIGNAHYLNTPELSNPVNDASDVANALKAVGFDVTLKLDTTKRQMDLAIAQFARDAEGADASLFYYAGHGLQYQGRNFIMPIDAELQDEISLRYELASIIDVKEALQQSSGIKIMVLDACRTNPLAERLARSIKINIRDIPKVQGYSRAEQTSGMIIVYATQADDVAIDGTGRNSPFSAAFLKEIKEPGIEIGTMFRRIAADVYAATNGRQSPELSVSLLSEYFLNQAETDRGMWARIRTSADVGPIREFLKRYPDSFYAPDAAARLELLDRAAPEPSGAAQPTTQHLDGATTDATLAKGSQQDQEAALACKSEQMRLAQLRGNPSRDDVAKFAQELTCENLRPQLNRLMESVGIEPIVAPPAAATTSPGQSEGSAADKGRTCSQEEERLARLRANPSADQITQFAREFTCKSLRPQVGRLMESLGIGGIDAVAETSTSSPAAPLLGADSRSPSSSANTAKPLESGDFCRQEAEELSRIRANPDLGSARRFAHQLKCEALKAQVGRLLESLGD
jgi:Caspase domain